MNDVREAFAPPERISRYRVMPGAYFGPAWACHTLRCLALPSAGLAADANDTLMTLPPLSHLDRLEAESIHILREVAAEFRAPVMLYSVGKDSSVLLHLLLKAFAPSPPPIPLLHVDTRWKFREMIAFRDRRAAETAVDLRVHINPEGVAQDIGPISHGAAVHTDVMKTRCCCTCCSRPLPPRHRRSRCCTWIRAGNSAR